MSRHQTRHLVEKPGAHGPRWFWQPSEKLRALGWRQHRLAATTLAEAMTLAEAHNAEIDAQQRNREGMMPRNLEGYMHQFNGKDIDTLSHAELRLYVLGLAMRIGELEAACDLQLQTRAINRALASGRPLP